MRSFCLLMNLVAVIGCADSRGGAVCEVTSGEDGCHIIKCGSTESEPICSGPAGRDGKDGVNGADGVDGEPGEQGHTGPEGPQGEQGPAGSDGEDGVDGEDGRDGVNCFDGLDDTNGDGIVDVNDCRFTEPAEGEGEGEGIEPPEPEPAFGTFILNLPGNDLMYDHARNVLYVSVPAVDDDSIANGISQVNPDNGEHVNNVFVGSSPGPLAIDEEASVLYVGITGASQIRAVNLEAFEPGEAFAVGNDPFHGPLYAGRLAVMPGHLDRVAVSTRRRGVSPSFGGVMIFDSGVRLPNVTPDHTGASEITFDADGTLYGFNSETSGYQFYIMEVDDDGVRTLSEHRGLLRGNIGIVCHNGLVFSDSGLAMDPHQNPPAVTGEYQGIDLDAKVIPDEQFIYFVFIDGGNGSAHLRKYDRERFMRIGEEEIDGGLRQLSVIAAVKCGAHCVAYLDSGQQLVIHRSELVN